MPTNPQTNLDDSQTPNPTKDLILDESSANEPDSDENQTLNLQDLIAHQQLTQAVHTLDLLNAQLGVAGALLVNLYHQQRQKESIAAQQSAYPGYPQPNAPTQNYMTPPPVGQPTYLPPTGQPNPPAYNPYPYNPPTQNPGYTQPMNNPGTPPSNQTQSNLPNQNN